MIIPNIWENKKCSKPPTSIDDYRWIFHERNHPAISRGTPMAMKTSEFPSCHPLHLLALGQGSTGLGHSLVISARWQQRNQGNVLLFVRLHDGLVGFHGIYSNGDLIVMQWEPMELNGDLVGFCGC